MKKIIIAAILLLACNCIHAQQNKTCFVQYENYANNSWLYNCYFLKDTMMFTFEKVYKKMYQSFPVYDKDGNARTETDTVKFKKEYYEHLDFLINHDKKREQVVTNKRAYNSNILTRYQEEKNNKQRLCVIDTLASMDNWEILEDTTTLLTYKCQKAKINYNNLEYEAWFTTQLPYNAGPKEFRGLPGLILKVSTKNEEKGFTAKEIVFPYNGVLPKYCFDGEVWSQKKYTAYVEELNRNSNKAFEQMIKNLTKDQKVIN